MIIFHLVIWGVFEYSIPLGVSGGMSAGCAVENWQHGFGLNPALFIIGKRFGAGASYVNPYGLPEVQCGNLGIKARWGRLNSGFAISSIGVAKYHEHNVQLGLAGEIFPYLGVGINVHGLIQNVPQGEGDAVLGIDAGVLWKTDRFKLGVAGMSLNSPRLNNGDRIYPSFRIGGGWEPTSGLLLAGDICRENGVDILLAGLEVRVLPEVKIRAGIETLPLSYCGGVGFRVDWFGLNYSYRFHPELEGTHILGIFCEWE